MELSEESKFAQQAVTSPTDGLSSARCPLLKLKPQDALCFDAGDVRSQRLILTNVSSGHVAFRIQATPAKPYTVHPDCGVLRLHESQDVQIIMRDGRNTDRFCVQAVGWSGSEGVTREQWAVLPEDAIEEYRLLVVAEALPGDSEDIDRLNLNWTERNITDSTDVSDPSSSMERQSTSNTEIGSTGFMWSHLEAHCSFVRKAATEALGEITGDDESFAMSEALNRLEDPNHGVRKAALGSLGQLAPQGCQSAFVSILDRIAVQQDWIILEDLCGAIPLVAEVGNPKAIAVLLALSADASNCWVRLHSTTGLRRLALKGDSVVIARLLALAEDNSWQVREAAVVALGHLVENSDKVAALKVLSTLRNDCSKRVRMAAANAYNEIATKSCEDSGVLDAPAEAEVLPLQRSVHSHRRATAASSTSHHSHPQGDLCRSPDLHDSGSIVDAVPGRQGSGCSSHSAAGETKDLVSRPDEAISDVAGCKAEDLDTRTSRDDVRTASDDVHHTSRDDVRRTSDDAHSDEESWSVFALIVGAAVVAASALLIHIVPRLWRRP
jgi:HEAT repeat protein